MFISGVDEDVATGDVAEYYAGQRAAWGFLPNYAPAFSTRPDVAAAWNALNLAVRGAVEAGIGLHPAIGMASAQPARYLGLSDRGELRRGLRADVVVLDRAQGVQRVFVAGEELPGTHAGNQKRS